MDFTPKSKAMSKDDMSSLIDIIQSRPILTSKETNASTNKLKEETWDSVTAAFNARCGSIPRTKPQLKLKWDNLKKAARKRAQQLRMSNLNTDGGKPDFIPPDEILEKLTGLLGSTCSGFELPFGGDGVGLVLAVDDVVGDSSPCLGEISIPLDDTLPNVPDEEVETTSKGTEKKKRRLFNHISDSPRHEVTKFFFGTPMPKQLVPLKKGKKTDNDGRLARNLAVARYYDTKTKKLDIEIEILKLELSRKQNDYCID